MIVYQATNQCNGKAYIGVTIRSLSIRRAEHHWDTVRGSPLPFHRAMRKYGEDSFSWKVLATCQHQDDLFAEEVKLISELKPAYNAATGGRVGQGHLGFKHSDKAKAKMRAAKLGRKLTLEHRAKIGARGKGRELSQEARNKISAANRGQARSAESCAKMRASAVARLQTPEGQATLRKQIEGRRRAYETRLAARQTAGLSCSL